MIDKEELRIQFEYQYRLLAETFEMEDNETYVDKDLQFTWLGYKRCAIVNNII